MGELGPLEGLEGVWEGDGGKDVSPADDAREEKINLYRERMVFEPTGQVDNHDQTLFGLRYSTCAWRLDESDPFHEDQGYWLWDANSSQVFRCFTVPRGVSVNAGGVVAPDASKFTLVAKAGDPVYGVSCNPFLGERFRVDHFEITLTRVDKNTIHYWENTVMTIAGRAAPFEHTDENTLTRVPQLT